jgi:acetylornithine deacetylase/succinyl-diaminopimelate desuccinylase-like protein
MSRLPLRIVGVVVLVAAPVALGLGTRSELLLALAAQARAGSAGAAPTASAAGEPNWPELRDETLRHFQAMLRFDTSNPPGNEVQVTDYLKGVLEREGIPVQMFAADPKRPNLVARIKGSGRKPPILYMGHTDVVTVDPAKWTFPPFSATRDGGFIYGRGSLDDKPHVIAGLMLMLELKRLNVPLDRDVIFLAESGEEGSIGVGIDYMVREHPDAIRAESCFAEGAGGRRAGGKIEYVTVQTMEKLPRTIELRATGAAGHGSVPTVNNAVVHLASAVAALGTWRAPVKPNETTREFFRRLAEMSSGEEAARYRAVVSPESPEGQAALEYMRAHQPSYASMLQTSLTPTIIDGGYRFNVIPSEATATIDVRMVPDEDPAQFIESVRRVINDPTVTVSYAKNGLDARFPAGRSSELTTEAYRAVQSAVARDYDSVTIPTMGTGATDMAQVRSLNIQCYGIGPAGDIEDAPKGFGAHSDQERILESELQRFVRFSWDIVVGLARTSPGR